MKHFFRIVIEIFAPPLLGALGAYLLGAGSSPLWLASPVSELQLHVLYGYLYAVVPSVIYAGCMEFAFSLGMKPSRWEMVALSGLLCAGAGYLTARYWEQSLLTFALLGFAAGLLVGVFLRLLGPALPNERQHRGRGH